MKTKDKSHEELKLEVEKLRAQLAEAEETLRAIRSGEVDALVVSGEKGEQVFTLKGAERPYRILMEKMKEGAVILAGDDTIFYCNQGFADMLKRPLEKMIGTGISQFVSPANKQVFEELLRRGRKIGSKGEATFLASDGTAVPIHLSLNAMPLDGISIAYLVATDLTEQKQILDELRRARGELEIRVEERTSELVKSEKRYRSLFENLMDGFAYCKMLFDDDGRPADFFCLEINSALGQLTGLENVVGKKVTEVIPGIKESNPELFEIFGRVALTGRPETFEFEFKPLGAWFSTSVYSPEKEYFAVVFDDITERKRAEEALRKAHDQLELRVQERTAELEEANKALLESESSYRELTESIDDLFYAMDRDLRYTYWNKTSEALTGILAKNAIGKSLYELFPDIRGTKAEQFYIEALKTQQPPRFESQFQIGGKKFIFEINAYPTKTGLSVIAKDITDKKILEAQLLRAQRMEGIGTLAGGIAHDLNNVLTPIMLSLQMLKDKFKDEQSQKLLTVLEKNSERGTNLIKQVLLFSRGVVGERKPLQITDHISEIEKVVKETFPRNIDIRTDTQKDLFAISGDSTQLHQVIMNLCVNARDAMPDGGILEITASNFFIDENYVQMHTEAKVGSYVVIAVSDTGIGIPPKIVDRIFEPFFTTKEFGKGTGLGLSTALAIVKSHGGFINVYSEVEKGTTFRVYFPAIKTEMQTVEDEQPELLVGHGEWVLVAEDEDSVRDVTVSTMEKYGYNVLTANDGADAVALYVQNRGRVDVILMDMMMPVMDGHASIRAIRKINPEVKIIAVSGLVEKDKLKKVADYTNAFLPKPYTAERLLKTIREVIGNNNDETGLNNRWNNNI